MALPVARHPERHEHAERGRSFGRQIGEGRGGRAPPDLAEREPVGAEVHALEGEVDAEGEGARPDAQQRAVVAQPASGGAEAREDGAQAVELSACSQAERSAPCAHAVSGGPSPARTGGPPPGSCGFAQARQISGSAASTSAGRRLRAVHWRAPCSAARPRAWAPSAAASGPTLPRARNAPMKPASRSPEPPVASPGLPLATTWISPRRSAITVGTPFSSTVPFTFWAAFAAAAQRSFAAVSASSSPNWTRNS